MNQVDERWIATNMERCSLDDGRSRGEGPRKAALQRERFLMGLDIFNMTRALIGTASNGLQPGEPPDGDKDSLHSTRDSYHIMSSRHTVAQLPGPCMQWLAHRQ